MGEGDKKLKGEGKSTVSLSPQTLLQIFIYCDYIRGVV
jgi:hypothetical protein